MISLIGPGPYEEYGRMHHFPPEAMSAMRNADHACLTGLAILVFSQIFVCARVFQHGDLKAALHNMYVINMASLICTSAVVYRAQRIKHLMNQRQPLQ